MKMRTRLFTLLLTALLASSTALVSCSDKGNDPADTTTAGTTDDTTVPETTTPETELTDGLPDTQMDGFALRFMNTSTITWVEQRLTIEDEDTAGDILSAAIHDRTLYIEDRFDAILDVEIVGSQYNQHYRNVVAGGDSLYDIIMLYGIEVAGLVDCVADMNNIPHLSYDEQWWNPNASDIFCLGEKRIAAAGNFSLSYVSAANCITFNKRIYEELNRDEDLYELVRDGKWTQDKFYEIAASAVRDIDGNGEIDYNDQMGSAGTDKAFLHMMVIGSGLRYVTKDADNYPQFNLSENSGVVTVLQNVIDRQIASPNYYCMLADGAKHTRGFADGAFLFYVTWPHNMADFRDMEDDFGVIPAPKFDEKQTEYYANSANGTVATLPRSYEPERLENVGTLLEAMSFYTQYNIIPVYKDVVLDFKITRDKDSAEMLDIVFAGVTFDIGINVWQAIVGNKIVDNIFRTKTDAVVSTLVSMQPTVEMQIQNLRKAVEEMP